MTRYFKTGKLPRIVCVSLLAAWSLFAVAKAQNAPSPNFEPPPVDEKTLEKAKDVIDAFETGTLMFDRKDIDGVNKIITALLSGIKQEEKKETTEKDGEEKENLLSNLLDQLGDKEQTALPKSYTFPSFYMSSVVYYSANDWAVWINGFKFSNRNNKKIPPLYVENISKTQATIVWFPAKSLHEGLKEIQGKNKKRDRFVSFDSTKGTFTFTLKPNETFVSGISSIKEGRVASLEIARKIEVLENGSSSGQLQSDQNLSPDFMPAPNMSPNGVPPTGMPGSGAMPMLPQGYSGGSNGMMMPNSNMQQPMSGVIQP